MFSVRSADWRLRVLVKIGSIELTHLAVSESVYNGTISLKAGEQIVEVNMSAKPNAWYYISPNCLVLADVQMIYS